MNFWQFLQQNWNGVADSRRQPPHARFGFNFDCSRNRNSHRHPFDQEKSIAQSDSGDCQRDANNSQPGALRFSHSLPFIGGIGARTAIVALVVYALLPIIRNTVTGILGVIAMFVKRRWLWG